MEMKLASPPPAHGGAYRTFLLWLRTFRLAGAILLEGVCSLLALAVFPWRRRRERARIAAIIQGTGASGGCLVLLGALIAGCSSGGQPMPGTSFTKQVEELKDSTLDLIDMSDARDSLSEDLYAMAEMEPVDELLWDLKHLFTAPDARASLASDLEELSDPEPGALLETCEMFGW